MVNLDNFQGLTFNNELVLDKLKITLDCAELSEDPYDSCQSLGPSSDYETNCEIYTYCYNSKDKKYFVRYEVGHSCNTIFKATLYQS